jgi:CheY-like chemotaxis protein
VVKIADLNSRISFGTTDKSRLNHRINQYISESSPSEKAVIKNTDSFKVGNELASTTKQILVIDDDLDTAIAIRTCLESYFKKDAQGREFRVLEVTMYSNPLTALVEFKPYYYDLLLVDINMPTVNGYELVDKVTKLDLNIKVCFMSAGEVNYEAIREIHHPIKSFGCFIKKPATRDYLINRVIQELF